MLKKNNDAIIGVFGWKRITLHCDVLNGVINDFLISLRGTAQTLARNRRS